VYGIARGLLFEPLPYAHEGELATFWKKTDWSEQEFLHVRGRFPGFREVALYRLHQVRVQERDAPTRLLSSVSASAELFDVLGARALHGRGFQAGDDVQGAESVAVLSHALWQKLVTRQSSARGSRSTALHER
jgi:putative ABC transport system permease protein